MKEYQVEGLMELKADYMQRLQDIGYQALATEFKDKALQLAREAVTASGLSLADVPMLEAATKLVERGEVVRCGFCTNCITDCKTCICRQPGD